MTILQLRDEPETDGIVPTGILMDSLNNEIMIQLKDGYPAYYFSNIITPVCNTGECLPVKINLYWDLLGNYKKYDQPEGEILTKLDHVPFTQEDYDLMDEILRDQNDPRRVSLVKHSKDNPSVSQGSDSNQDQAMPAPTKFVIKTKYQMVDGITGSTLPEVEDKFVPGALYTTYTLWALAHDFGAHMKNYTNFSLLVPKYYGYFLASDYYQTREEVIALIMGNSSKPNIHAEVCCSLLDTSSVEVQQNILSHFRSNEYDLPIVQDQFIKTFQNSSDDHVKNLIISKWLNYSISNQVYTTLSSLISENEAQHDRLIKLFNKDFRPSKENFDLWMKEIEELESPRKEQMIQVLKDHKADLDKSQKKKLKKLK